MTAASIRRVSVDCINVSSCHMLVTKSVKRWWQGTKLEWQQEPKQWFERRKSGHFHAFFMCSKVVHSVQHEPCIVLRISGGSYWHLKFPESTQIFSTSNWSDCFNSGVILLLEMSEHGCWVRAWLKRTMVFSWNIRTKNIRRRQLNKIQRSPLS